MLVGLTQRAYVRIWCMHLYTYRYIISTMAYKASHRTTWSWSSWTVLRVPPRRRRTEMPVLAKGKSKRLHVSVKYVLRPKSRHMGGCQNYGPFLGTLNTRCRIITGIQKGTIIIILTTTHMSYSRYIPYIHGRGSVLGNIFGILLNYQKGPMFGRTRLDKP